MSHQHGGSLTLSRREIMKGLGVGAVAGGMSLFARSESLLAQLAEQTNRGAAPVRIRQVRAITTAPQNIRLVVVKVETTEPGLYGLGCATFNQRPLAVVEAVDKYLDPFARDRDVDLIEDMWQNAYTSSYWRNGPVLNNALSGYLF